MTQRARADWALVLMAFLWGTSFAIVKSALNDVSSVLLMAIRFTLAALLLVPVCGIGNLLKRASWPADGRLWMVLTGVALALGYILQTTGLRFTTAGKSAFLTGLYIVLLPLLTFCVYKSAPVLREWTGVAMAIAGMALMNWDGTAWRWGKGEVLTVACAVAYAAHLLLLAQATRHFEAKVAGLAQIAICAAVLWLSMYAVEEPFLRPSAGLAVAVLVTTVFATAIPFVLLSWAQQHTTPVRSGLLLSLEMPFGALAGWWFLGEKLSPSMLAGAALILAGAIAVEWKTGDETGAAAGASA